ncbi:MAG: hypothetical protein EOP62_20055 [Sphingomonadales bacterium]|nr:MAG: hypothetical protein EOP62_20055 [Sphingomonadales bacterium]
MLQLRDVTKAYGRKRLLDGVTAAFAVGLTLLTGPSGAGKSTLLRLIVVSAQAPFSAASRACGVGGWISRRLQSPS